MNEYKIIKSKFHWKDNMVKFENLLNEHASQGWKVVGFPNQTHEAHTFMAVLERSKNR
jgi:glutathione peroxidase-family protein